MVVGMSRRTYAELYDAIMALRPHWHRGDDDKGTVKVIITGPAADGPELARRVRSKQALHELKARAKNPDDPLELVIVRDMWLTGFDSPAMHTMYVDKPIRGAGLMQAIARVNRTFRDRGDRAGGLVVDYIGIAESLGGAGLRHGQGESRSNHGGAGAPAWRCCRGSAGPVRAPCPRSRAGLRACRVLARGAAVQGRSGVLPGRCGRAPTAPRRRIPWCG